ncbi:MAG: nucleotidyltransferase family protein [Acidobacteria bacterium]|nr:nucleotidyltransferase family protein [Acidobacteriota bacterium]
MKPASGETLKVRIPIPRPQLEACCRKYHIRRLALFGSVLREDFGPDSDVDVLVDFEEGHVPGLAFFDIQRELTEILGRDADLNTPDDLSPYYRQQVMEEAEDLYVEA